MHRSIYTCGAFNYLIAKALKLCAFKSDMLPESIGHGKTELLSAHSPL
jgi:hypothetical protein